jgi:hypothetical protein
MTSELCPGAVMSPSVARWHWYLEALLFKHLAKTDSFVVGELNWPSVGQALLFADMLLVSSMSAFSGKADKNHRCPAVTQRDTDQKPV